MEYGKRNGKWYKKEKSRIEKVELIKDHSCEL